MTLTYLPTITVKIGFTPSDINSTSTWGTMTDVSKYVRRLGTKVGRQHFLERIEAGTIDLTLSNRDGFLTNGAKNGTGATIRARIPITLSVNWAGTDYPLFSGLIDNVDESVTDALNSDLHVQATDFLKNLSLRYLLSPNLYQSYVTPATWSSGLPATVGAMNYYRFDPQSAYAGSVVDVLPYDATTAPASGVNASVVGVYSQAQQGVCVYDNRTCIDLTNATGNASAYLSMNSSALSVGSSALTIDFWVLGSNLAGTQLTNGLVLSGSATAADLFVTANGQVGWEASSLTTTGTVNDGYWHHVALVSDKAGNIAIGVDGQWVTSFLGGGAYVVPSIGSNGFYLGANNSGAANFPGYIDHVVLSICPAGSPSSGTYCQQLQSQVASRAAIGSLLLRDTSPGDAVAAVLIIAGFGGVSSTSPGIAQYSVGQYVVDDSAYTNSAFYTQNPAYGVMNFQGYGANQQTVFNSSAFDVITSICDTEAGDFYVDGIGTFQFQTRAYPYAASRQTGLFSLADNGSDCAYRPENLRLMMDDADIWTTVKVSIPNGTEQVYENTTAMSQSGYSTLTRTANCTNVAQALATAQYLGYIYAYGQPRVQSVELRASTSNGAYLPQMLGADVNQNVYFTRTPPNATGYHFNALVESYSHDFDAASGEWTTTFVLDPYPLTVSNKHYSNYMIADDTVYGLADGSNLAI